MIGPNNITKFDRTEYELEELAVFSVLVAGKMAKVISKSLDRLLFPANGLSPFKYLNSFSQDELAEKLYQVGIGCHSRKSRTLKELFRANLNLETCSREELMGVWGIGDKTANFFILHSREAQNIGAIDTHIQKFLGIKLNGSNYVELEKLFLEKVAESGMTAAELDLEIWKHYSQKKEGIYVLSTQSSCDIGM